METREKGRHGERQRDDRDADREGDLRRRLLLAGRGDLRAVDGVIDTAVGYEGGHVDNPTYEQVCSGTTGHVEVCQVEFDPERVSFETLVEKYFDIHDPTQLNRQGFDVGYQYRSAIFAHSDEQAEVAREVIERVQRATRPRSSPRSSPRSRSGAPRSITSATSTSAAPAPGCWVSCSAGRAARNRRVDRPARGGQTLTAMYFCLEELVDALVAALAPDAGLLDTAERRPCVRDHALVEPGSSRSRSPRRRERAPQVAGWT